MLRRTFRFATTSTPRIQNQIPIAARQSIRMSSTDKSHATDPQTGSVVPEKVQEKVPKGVEDALPDAAHDTNSSKSHDKGHSYVPKPIAEALPKGVEEAVPDSIHDTTGDKSGVTNTKTSV